MTQVRFNHRDFLPERMEYPVSQNLVNWFWGGLDGNKNRTVPLANIVETKEDFRIELSTPGFSKNDFKINLDGQYLTISGEIGVSGENQEDSFLRQEFSPAAFSRSFRLSNWVDSSSIAAKYENGILLVTIPKREELKSKPAKEIVVE